MVKSRGRESKEEAAWFENGVKFLRDFWSTIDRVFLTLVLVKFHSTWEGI